MSELTDLEICKRIGEIESLNGDFGTHLNGAHGRRYIDGSFKYYSPLTDDALCFQLMIKYDCDVISPYRPNNDTHWECQIFTDNCADAVSIYDDSPNKAICLAIIEAHKDQS
jgi:hypothetical protein